MNKISYPKFSKDVALVGFTNILASFKSFILLSILTKNLGTMDYGIWAQIEVTLSLLMPIVLLGQGEALVRFLAGQKERKARQDGFFSALIITGVAGSVFAFLLAAFSIRLSKLFFGGSHSAAFMQIAALLLVVQPLVALCLVYFTSLRQIGIRSWLLIFTALAEIGLIGLSFWLGLGLQGVIIALITVNVLASGISLVMAGRQLGWGWPEFRYTKSYLVFGVPLIPSSYFWLIANAGDRYVIGFFEEVSFVEYMRAAYTLGSLPFTVLQSPINTVLLPTITHLWEDNNIAGAQLYIGYALKYSMMLTIPAVIGLIVLAGPILTVMATPDFASAAPVVLFVTLGFIFLSVAVIGQYILTLPKRTGIITMLYGCAAIVNITLNIVLVPILGIVGAAFATTVTYLLLAVVMVYIARKYIKFGLQILFVIKSLIASGMMGFLVWGIMPDHLFEIVMVAGLGVIVYFVILFVLKGFSMEEVRFFLSLVKVNR